MSNWQTVAIIAESLEQQVNAAIGDLDSVRTDDKAIGFFKQTTHALRSLCLHARERENFVLEVKFGKVRLADAGPIVTELCDVADVSSELFLMRTKAKVEVSARSALAWMMRNGITFVHPPSWTDVARMFDIDSHSTVCKVAQEAHRHADLVRAMFDRCEKKGIPTNPRPDWARKEVA